MQFNFGACAVLRSTPPALCLPVSHDSVPPLYMIAWQHSTCASVYFSIFLAIIGAARQQGCLRAFAAARYYNACAVVAGAEIFAQVSVNKRVELAGMITFPEPSFLSLLPYPSAGGIHSTRVSPTAIP